MKNLFKLMLISLISLAAMPSFSQTDFNYLKLTGEFENEKKVETQLYSFDIKTQDWVLEEEDKFNSKYKFRLDPTEHYKLVFINRDNNVKTMEIIPGDAGIFYINVDIMFTNSNCAKLKQRDDYGYRLTLLPRSNEVSLKFINHGLYKDFWFTI